MPSLTCPRCGEQMTIHESAPPTLVCPRCLARIGNPGESARVWEAPAFQLTIQPRRVISIEHQVQRDTRTSGYVLFLLAALLGAGAWLSFGVTGGAKVGGMLATACVIVLVTIVLQMRFPESETVGNVSEIVGTLASGLVKVFLIVIGVMLLLLGACAVLVSGANALGG